MFRRSRSDKVTTGNVVQHASAAAVQGMSAGGDFDGSSTDGLASEVYNWIRAPRPTLGEVLVEMGHVLQDDLDRTLEIQLADGRPIGDLLLEIGLIDEMALAEGLARQFDLPVVDLRAEEPEAPAINALGEELSRRHRVLPMRIDDSGRVFIAMRNPLDGEAISDLTSHCTRIGLMVAAGREIDAALERTFDALRSADEHIRAFTLADDTIEASDTSLEVDENSPIVQVVNRIITQGVRNRASDIHIEGHASDVRVRYRIDGALSDAIRLPARMGAPISSRIKVLADLNIVERRRPQDGQFSVVVDNRPIDIRTSAVPTVHGEKIVLRLLDKTRTLISLKDLGMPPNVVAPFSAIVKAPLGMVLCTGPTGSGKTTTLYATLTEINDPAKNVVTIEDPVEYQFDGVNQMPVHEHGGISFADGLRGILRQDPDIILVGEIRDIDTARIATQAALTGHFVLSSLHAIDAASALHRFTDMGIEPFLVASAINGVVGQRLMRRVCNSCRTTYAPTPDHIRLVVSNAEHPPSEWTRGAGCNVCNGTGYSGRIGVYELLSVTDTIREMIIARVSHIELREQAIEDGMRTMQQEAFRMVSEGVTTVDEVLRSVYGPTVDLHETKAPVALPAGRKAVTAVSSVTDELEEHTQDDDDVTVEIPA